MNNYVWVLKMMRDRDARTECERDAMNEAIKALEYREPMKPTKLHTYRYCPRCDFRLTTRSISVNGEKATVHCECCGQAITDWSDEDE